MPQQRAFSGAARPASDSFKCPHYPTSTVAQIAETGRGYTWAFRADVLPSLGGAAQPVSEGGGRGALAVHFQNQVTRA